MKREYAISILSNE